MRFQTKNDGNEKPPLSKKKDLNKIKKKEDPGLALMIDKSQDKLKTEEEIEELFSEDERI